MTHASKKKTAPRQHLLMLMGLLVGLILLSGCDADRPASSAAPQLVTASPVRNGVLQRQIDISGVSRAQQRAQLAFQSSGILQQRLVRLGDRVVAGQLLAELRNPELEPALQAGTASIARLEAERVQAQRNLRRLQDLFRDGAIGEQQLEEQQTRLATLEDQLSEANANLSSSRERADDAALRAGFDATVVSVLREPGEFVQAGTSVLELAGDGMLEVELQVPHVVWQQQQLGAEVPMTVRELNGHISATFKAQIRDIGGLANARSGLYPVVLEYAAVQDSALSPGQRVSAAFDIVIADQLLVELNAIVDPTGGAARVYRLDGMRDTVSAGPASVTAVPVQVLGIASGRVAVSGDLQQGDLVVSAGNLSMVSGQQVRVQAAAVAAEDELALTP
jgi:RND family efflux transporter MFP subunit